jgi:hypothetical protein
MISTGNRPRPSMLVFFKRAEVPSQTNHSRKPKHRAGFNVYENQNYIHKLHSHFAWAVRFDFSFTPSCLLWIFVHGRWCLERRP